MIGAFDYGEALRDLVLTHAADIGSVFTGITVILDDPGVTGDDMVELYLTPSRSDAPGYLVTIEKIDRGEVTP